MGESRISRLWSPTCKPVPPLSPEWINSLLNLWIEGVCFADSVREWRYLLILHHDRNPGHKKAGSKAVALNSYLQSLIPPCTIHTFIYLLIPEGCFQISSLSANRGMSPFIPHRGTHENGIFMHQTTASFHVHILRGFRKIDPLSSDQKL